jgi:hypothetical protein
LRLCGAGGANDVWAAPIDGSLLLHYNGTSSTAVTPPTNAAIVQRALWRAGKANVWGVGTNGIPC